MCKRTAYESVCYGTNKTRPTVSERVHRALVPFDFPLRIKELSARWPHNAQASKLPSLKQILPRKRTVAEVSVEW